MKKMFPVFLVAAVAFLIIVGLACDGSAESVEEEEVPSEETLQYFRDNLFDEKTLDRIRQSLVEEEVAEEEIDRSKMTEFTGVVKIKVTLIPLEPDEAGETNPIVLNKKVEVFGWIGKEAVIIGDIFRFPPRLPDGRPYRAELEPVLFLEGDKLQPQEKLGEIIYPRDSKDKMPVMVFKRTNPVFAIPQDYWQEIAPASTLVEGAKLYQAFSVTGAIKTVEAEIIEVSSEGSIFFEGNLDGHVLGSVLFTKEGLPVALTNDLVGSQTGIAVPLEYVLKILKLEGVVGVI